MPSQMQAPSEYIPEMRKIHTADKLSQVLASHLVNESDESGLMADDYERFIDERLAAAVIEIERLTGGKVADDPEV